MFRRLHLVYRLSLTVLLLLVTIMVWSDNRIFSPRVKTLTSIVGNDWMNRPVMTLGSDDVLNIGFDEFSHNYHRLTCHIDHCEADWSTSEEIFESDWLQGFNDWQIGDYQNSINTTVLFTHYQLTIPNEYCQLKMSGNYRLTIYDEDNADEKLLEVEFYVVEPLMTIGVEVTTNTDIDHNDSHQQLSFSLNYNELRVTDLETQLQTVVMQNWQSSNARHNVQPNHITPNGLLWQHNRQLIFDGGNEYHKFEILDVSHTTMGLDRIHWDGTNYQAYPFPATPRKNYLTDADADGAFCIRNSNRFESDYTCDYVWVNYELQSPYQGELYIDGQWATDKEREHYRMCYDGTHKVYHTALLQKQGYYNYRYVTADGKIPSTEGNFFQTENRYQVLVYYKEAVGRTWQLVGYRAVEFR